MVRHRATSDDILRLTCSDRPSVACVDEELVSSTELAKALSVSHRTIQRWIAAGKIEAEFRTVGGQYKFNIEKVREQLRAIEHE
jgi:excisionase family DNA binding protein